MGSSSSKLKGKKHALKKPRPTFSNAPETDYNKPVKSVSESKEAFESTRAKLGPDHPHTLSSMFEVGRALHAIGYISLALQTFRELLPLREKVFGRDHPNTIATLDAICEELCNLGKYQLCTELLVDEVLRCERRFGEEHERTIRALGDLSNMYRLQNKFDDASSGFFMASRLSPKRLGPDHQLTLAIRNDSRGLNQQKPVSQELMQALYAKHNLPIPGDLRYSSISSSQMFDNYESIVGATSAGPEAAAALSLSIGESTRHRARAPAIIPPYYSDSVKNSLRPLPNKKRTLSAKSESLRSLIDRSIEAWGSIEYQGQDPEFGHRQAIEKYSEVLIGVRSLEELLSLDKDQFWFFQLREALLRQDTPTKWSPDRLDDYILLPIGERFTNQTDCIFFSHYWRTEEHPDPEGEDLRLQQKRLEDGFWSHVSYFWMDFTCLPQGKRTAVQEKYFRHTLQSIPILVRDCTFIWRFPPFEPRLWVFFELAQFTFNRSRPIPLVDSRPFMRHVSEMKGAGVSFVINKYGYRCKSQGDREQIIAWLEMLLILYRVVPSIRTRREILNVVDNSTVSRCHHVQANVEVDKARGIIIANGTTYTFTPLPILAADAVGTVVCIQGDHEAQLSKARRRAFNAFDNWGVSEIAREYDREGDHDIAEALHRQALSAVEKERGEDHIYVTSFLECLAENLEKQGRFEESEQVYNRKINLEQRGSDVKRSSDESVKNLKMVMQKRKLHDLYRRWGTESLESILDFKCPESSTSSRENRSSLPVSSRTIPAPERTWLLALDRSIWPSEDPVVTKSMEEKALGLEGEGQFSDARGLLWDVLQRRKETLGPYHPSTRRAMSHLARVLRVTKDGAAAETLYWTATAVSEHTLGPLHLDTVQLLQGLAIVLLVNNKGVEAKEIYRQVLERKLQSMTWDDPDLFSDKFNLQQILDENERLAVFQGKVRIFTKEPSA
ncbi:hypothetical protein FQN49_004996 [Arthroderma sp. PD_2]|nr:hypothetical protein FQN49_004996 [Arthroderma sp. PD_2]